MKLTSYFYFSDWNKEEMVSMEQENHSKTTLCWLKQADDDDSKLFMCRNVFRDQQFETCEH